MAELVSMFEIADRRLGKNCQFQRKETKLRAEVFCSVIYAEMIAEKFLVPMHCNECNFHSVSTEDFGPEGLYLGQKKVLANTAKVYRQLYHAFMTRLSTTLTT
jgi:hypothetical protein